MEDPEVTIVTSGGIRQWDTDIRKRERGGRDLGKGRLMDLSRKTVTNYTRCRTNRGPFKSWGVTIRKEVDNTCPDCTIQHEHTGTHVAFECKKYRQARAEFLGAMRGWKGLDRLRGDKWLKAMGFFHNMTLSYS